MFDKVMVFLFDIFVLWVLRVKILIDYLTILLQTITDN